MASKKDQAALQEEQAIEKVSKIEQFYAENGKKIWTVVCALAVVALLVLAYQQFIVKPRAAEAAAQMYAAENSFADGEYELALNGDGNVYGFSEVLDEYKGRAPKAANFYAGVCELQLGNFQEALNYLKKYKGKDAILAARALACQADAYVGLEDYAKAAPLFEKAAAQADNVFAAAYLLKAGVVYEQLGDNAKALELYKTIKDKYPQSVEGYDVDKYIARLEAAL